MGLQICQNCSPNSEKRLNLIFLGWITANERVDKIHRRKVFHPAKPIIPAVFEGRP